MSTKVSNTPSPAVGSQGAVTGPQNAKGAKKVDAAEEAKAGSAKAGAEKNFNVELSAKAREMGEGRAKALEIARNTPDVREDKVADIKKRIADGSYQADAGGIADGMLREAIKDKLAGEPEI